MAQTTSLVFNGGVIPSPSPAPTGSGKAKLLKIGEITVTEQEVQVTKKVICDPDSITTVAPFMEVLTSAKLAELVNGNNILVLDDGTNQYLMSDASVSVEDGTAVCTAVNFLGLSKENRAKVLYPCTRITDELTLHQVLEVGEPVETGFDLVKAYPEDTEAGTLIDKLMVEDTVQGPDDQPLLEVVQGDGKVAINEDNLRNHVDAIYGTLDGIIDTLDEMDFYSVPRTYLHSSLNQSAGDSVTTRTTIDTFAVDALESECFEFEETTTIDDVPFGYVWIEPGTYLINASVTLQWVGNPRGTFIAKVGSVMGENFDFSQEQEISRQSTKVVTIPNRMKLAVNVTYDAGTPVMGFWISSMQVVKLAGGMSQTNIIHDSTLVGQGSVDSPLGVTKTYTMPDKNEGYVALNDGNGTGKFDIEKIFNNFAGKFVDNVTEAKANKLYIHNGSLYKVKENYQGLWDADKFKLVNVEDVIENNKKILEIGIADTICGQNLLNKDKLSTLGEWCNYANGKIESTQSVTTYRHSDYIKVEPSTSYARRNSLNVVSAGVAFFDTNFNFISGSHGARTFTSPTNAAYIIVNINTTYETADDAVLIKGSSPLAVGALTPVYYNDFKFPNPAYVSKKYLEENLPEFVASQNLLNKDKLGPLGEWCNYINGNFQSTQSVTTYRHSDYIPVKPITSYARRNKSQMYNAGYATFDANKTFISGGQAAVITTPANCKYIVINIDTTYESEAQALLIESGISYPSTGPNLPYYNDFKYPNPMYQREYVTVGASGEDFASVGEAFAYALANDKWVLIKPGVYDLVQEGISGVGYKLPKKVVGYGAKLVCNLDDEDWNLSPVNTHVGMDGFEIYGLEIECTNCRYCIHDDMGSRTTRKSYHNIFKDLILTHKSAASETLIAPDNIGGGFGDGGYIEIVNCTMTAAYSRNFAYHSNSFNQQKNCIVQCHGCYINKRIQLSPAGTPAEGVTNTLYVSDCVFGTYKPTSGITSNGTLVTKAWNNILESELQ